MLNELRRLFLEALRFDGDDAMPLVEKWNFAVKRVQGIFDGMTDKSSVQYIADKLAAYEDAEEQGLLVRLPCKVGDTFYYIAGTLRGNEYVASDAVAAIEISDTEPWIIGTDGCYHSEYWMTREKAEAELKGEREDV